MNDFRAGRTKDWVVSKDCSVLIGVQGFLESQSLGVTLAVPLGLDAVAACWLALVAFDASLSTRFDRVSSYV